jgi:hypothetical protein
MKVNTKKFAIYSALLRGERLTAYKALAYGTMRLAAVVFALRAEGYNIKREDREDGNGVLFTEYHLVSGVAANKQLAAA